MKATIWIILGVLIVLLGLVYLLRIDRLPNLSEAICQPSDLGERYHRFNESSTVTQPYVTETVVESYMVTLIDHQLTNTMLDCQIYRFQDAVAANRAFEDLCVNQVEANLKVGDERCAFAGNTPHNLAFRRNAYLVLMSTDMDSFPAEAVDKRLR
ncbi:hypothetical protein KC906_04880 [Candidatus Kaiserbacteria bacterium]|nr:hypothetical protein [Candidatus Kaiserbacteria bacterium]